MLEQNVPRLLVAAKEFNIGKDTLVDFLVKKGFDKDLLKPTSKLSVEMYFALQQEFQSDKSVKKNSQNVVISSEYSGSALSLPVEDKKRKIEEKEIEHIKIKTPSIEGPTIITKIDIDLNSKSLKKDKNKVPNNKENIKENNEINLFNLKDIEEETLKKTNESEIKIKIEETEIKQEILQDVSVNNQEIIQEVTNINIEETNFNQEVKEIKQVETQIKQVETQIKQVETEIKIEENIESNFEETKYTKLEGPKILGKVDLSLNKDLNKSGKGSFESEFDKKKRKRIIIEKKPEKPVNTNLIAPKKNTYLIDPANKSFNKLYKGNVNTNSNNNLNNNKFTKPVERVIDQQTIQDKIKETQAKLSGGSTGRFSKNFKKNKKNRKENNNNFNEAELTEKTIQVTEFISLRDFASLLNVDYTDVISKCLSLGLMVSINHRLDAEVMELIAGEYGCELNFIDIVDETIIQEEKDKDKEEDLIHRPPIVTIMGHVDHGKTSLLDFIRDTNVVAGESGGITQKIGAYEVTLKNGKQITFIDTPGHEAFTAMRARGTKVTDVAVIVIAADDAVMPQTKEAISHAQAANIKMIFAINKIDKEGANPEKIKEQLSQMNLLVEDWGGTYQCQEISAKKGLNVDVLLEKIALESEMLELKANPNRYAIGTVIDTSLDKGRGYMTSILVQNGTLKLGDMIVAGQFLGRIKAMFNERNQKINSAPPSAPVLILGINGAPQSGENFRVYTDESMAKEAANKRSQLAREQGLRTKKHITLDEIGRRLALGSFRELNVIIKADVDGSLEVLSDSLEKLSTSEVAVKIIHKGVGQITESDVTLATASDAIIIAFQVRPSQQASKLAEQEAIQIKKYSVIYNVIEEIKSAMEGMLQPAIEEKINANVEIRNIFTFEKNVIAGCYVTSGKIFRNNKIRIIRDGIVVYTGEIQTLKRFKDDVKEVATQMECGITIKNYASIKEGDIIEAFEEEMIKRNL